MRRRAVKLDQYGISRWQYEELKAYCRQYEEKKRAAAAMLGPRSGRRSRRETEQIVIGREALIRDVEIIESAARDTDGGRWYTALIDNCCRGVSYTHLPPESMPTSSRTAYFRARREFFFRLAKSRSEK